MSRNKTSFFSRSGWLALIAVIVLTALLIGILSRPAHAQMIPLASINLSSTITSTNTFQSIQTQTNNRNGCSIQNNGTHTMWVEFDSANSAACAGGAVTKGNSITLVPSQSVTCQVAGQRVLKDQVCITGTSGEAFLANFQ